MSVRVVAQNMCGEDVDMYFLWYTCISPLPFTCQLPWRGMTCIKVHAIHATQIQPTLWRHLNQSVRDLSEVTRTWSLTGFPATNITIPGIVCWVYAVLCTTLTSLQSTLSIEGKWKSEKGGREGSKWWTEVKRSGGRDTWDRGLLHWYSESVSGTSEVENICFVLKSALGLSHDETQPGAQQHSRILPLVSPLPPPPLANQEPAYPEETLHQPCNLSCLYAAFISYGNCLLNVFM